MSRQLVSALILLWMLAAPACAGVYEGWAASRRGDFATALSEFERLAEEGNFVAQYNLGVMYANGLGVPRDGDKAAHWFHEAAAGGDARAQYNLGNLYMDGFGVPKNLSQAAYWYAKAAEQGLGEAQYNLGRLYYIGAGVAQNFVEAYVWMQVAADQGVELARQGLPIIAGMLKPEIVEYARERARDWQADHARLSAAPR